MATMRSLEMWVLLLWFNVDAAAAAGTAAAFAAAAVTSSWGRGGGVARSDQLQSKELRHQLEKIQRSKTGGQRNNSLSFRHLQPTERQEIEMLTRNLCKFHGSPISLDDMHEYLPGSSWRLAFSTRDEIVSQLPSVDASIHLQFAAADTKKGDDDDDVAAPPQHVDYMIKLHKNRSSLSGVDTLKIGCSWQAAAGLVVFEDDDDAEEEQKGGRKKGVGGDSSFGNNNNNNKQVTSPPLTAVLEDIYNRNVNRKGLFIGRARFIKTTYFDGDVWIECGSSASSSSSSNKSFTNIYLRENYEPHFEYSI
jgi:hypothetical protein